MSILVSMFLMPVSVALETAPAPRGVILIMTDDMGIGDLGATGNPIIDTPHLDAMASRSTRMSTFYVHPVCAPTRACLMTGRYNHRTRAIDTYVGRAMMEPDEVTIAELLRDAGFATGIFGKWHLGDCHPMRPMDQGFERSLVHRGGGIGQPSDPPRGRRRYTDPWLLDDGELREFEGYCTGVYFDAALDFIEAAHEEGRPFFAYIATNAPHGPFHDVPPHHLETYLARDLDNRHTPHEGHPLDDGDGGEQRARIFAMITDIDDQVGRLFARLDQLGLTDDTLVIYMHDNGPNGRRYVQGFRGRKGDVHEGGIRSPFFAHWPARLDADRDVDAVTAHIDVLPTLLELCDVAPPADLALDGRSFAGPLQADGVEWPERTLFIQAHRGDTPVPYHHFAARSARWKLVHPTGFGRQRFDGPPRPQLVDMIADPYEEHDVADREPDVVARLMAEYDAWLADVSSTREDNYAPPRIVVGSATEPTTTLTRQDWRHEADRPWAPNSNGHWKLRVEKGGVYALALRFPVLGEETGATLWLDDRIAMTVRIDEGADEASLRAELPEGPVDLRVTLGDTNEETRGPLQIDLSRVD